MLDTLALDLVAGRVVTELRRERAAGNPLKAAYHSVARRLGITPRRVRAYHHGEVDADEVTAAELLAADAAWRREIETTKARLAVLEGYLADEAAADLARPLAAGRVDASRQGMRSQGRGLAHPPAALARALR